MRAMRTDHRPWPLPAGPWMMRQTWEKLLFAHWPVDERRLAPLLPRGLALDRYEGQAWLGIVPFYITGIRMHFLPPLPWTSNFAEINVRTYVTCEGKPGVYFFSLDAANLFTVVGARTLFHLPYYRAESSLERHTDGSVLFRSSRRGAGGSFSFEGEYRPVSEPFTAGAGTLEHWLTERYCLFAEYGGRIYCGDIHHDPWTLRRAAADIRVNTMTRQLPAVEPLLHYSERLDVLAWPVTKL